MTDTMIEVVEFGPYGFAIVDRFALPLRSYLGRGMRWTDGSTARTFKTKEAAEKVAKTLSEEAQS